MSDENRGDWQVYRRLLAYVKPYRVLFAVAIVGFLMGSAAEAYFADLLGDLIDTWGTDDLDAALMIPAAMFLAAIVRAAGAIIGELLLSIVSFNVVYNLRVQLFDQLLEMPSAYFDASAQGRLVSRITYNVAQLRDTGTEALRSIVQDSIKVMVYFGWMLYLSWQLTLIFVAAVPLLAIVVMFASRRFRHISKRIQNSMGDVTHVASEAVNGYRVVKVYGGEGYEQQRFHRASRVNRQQSVKMTVTKVSSTQLNEVLVAAAISLLVLLLFKTGVGSEMSRGDVVTFLGLAGLLARPIRKLTDVNAKLQRGLAAAEDVFGQMDEPRESDTGSAEVSRVQGHLELKNVSFAYQTGRESVIKNVSLTIEPGQTLALVGRSGSGKSTIASLIPRFYEVGSGEILLDGRPIQEYTLRSLRDQIALVNQQITLFNDTLEKNIAYGGLAETSREAILSAVDRAHATDFIEEMPEGLETVVGDNGVLLSGGQRQRIAIARALLKDAPILILDEATSALDNESERHIQAALEEVMKGRTTIVIAHRLSTIENADLIAVMEDGQLVEQGDHDTLLKQGGAYAALYQAQFDEDTPVAPAPKRQRRAPLRRSPQADRRSPGPAVRAIEEGWYEGAWWSTLLKPFAWLFGRVSSRRRRRFATAEIEAWRAPVPVVVIGNITAGGTGKTPLVVALCRWLVDQGFRPGIVSRGYGGALEDSVAQVPPGGDPAEFGDEPPMLARQTGCPVYIGSDRVKVVQSLLSEHDCDIVLSDDGLQHYALARDIELAVVDGVRGLGNGQLIPAGPLREPESRLNEVDLVVSNGPGFDRADVQFTLVPQSFVRLSDGERLPLDTFDRGTTVHAVCGIGHPARFKRTLESMGLDPLLTELGDHHEYRGSEVAFDDNWPVVVTEKDADKLRASGADLSGVVYLEVAAMLDDVFRSKMSEQLRQHGIKPQGTAL